MNSNTEKIAGIGTKITLVVLGLVSALSLATLAWSSWEDTRSHRVIEHGQVGTLCSVLLVNGQVYYGILRNVRPGAIELANIYYVQSFPQANGQTENRLVNRQKNDWHSPELMAIPNDKVMMLEVVGAQSRLAKLIESEKAAPK